MNLSLRSKTEVTGLTLEGVTRRFAERAVVDDVSLQVGRGQLATLLGPSGCGKTTTLRMIAGLERPDSGTIRINEQVVSSAQVHVPPEERGVGLVFQQYALFPHLTVEENVAFGLRAQKDAAARTQAMLERVQLQGRKDARISELSGGEQQRVALARALAPRPVAVLLDEPFANLDTGLRQAVRDDVENLIRESGALCILVTHDQEEALSLSDQVAVMCDGHLLQAGPPRVVYDQPQTLQVARLLGDGSEIGVEQDGARLQSPWGDLSTDDVTQASDDQHESSTLFVRPTLFIRPEMLRLSARGVKAKVLARHFTGPSTLFRVELANGEELKVLEPGHAQLGRDDHVEVELVGKPRLFTR